MQWSFILQIFELYVLGIVTSFPGGTVVKNPPANAGESEDVGLIPQLGRSPGRGKWQLTPVFLPGESHGKMATVRPATIYGVAELDKTKHTCTPFILFVRFIHNPVSSSSYFIFLK